MIKGLIPVAPKQFRALDLNTSEILTEEDLLAMDVSLLPDGSMSRPGLVPLVHTGNMDEQGQDVYEHDVVRVGINTGFGSLVEAIGVISWSTNANQFAVKYVAATPGVHSSKIIERLGSAFTHSHLLPSKDAKANG